MTTHCTVIRDFSDPLAFFFFAPNQQHEISKIGKGAGLGTEKARIRIFSTYMGIHQYRGLSQCTLDDSADKINGYRWKNIHVFVT